jgi:hypothetical protein
MELTKEYIKNSFKYNPENGEFKRIKRFDSKKNVFVECDRQVKAITSYGYLQVNILGKPRLVHRIIFLYMTGKLPKEDVDHINGDRLDNRWENLRLVTRKENLRNAGIRTDNTSGYPGVSFDRFSGKWHSYIHNDGKRTNIGYFETVEEAIKEKQKYEKLLGFHPNHGKRNGWSLEEQQ